MSAYITFWIRANSGGPYICLDCWGRSSRMYQLMKDFVQMETFKELAVADIHSAIEQAKTDIEGYDLSIKREEETIEFLRSCSLNGEEVLENFHDSKDSIEELEQEQEELKDAITRLSFYENIIEEQEYERPKAKATVYIALECDPNYSENEENEK